ncbi:MAG: rhomboid family intramembrane serine protease, partial [Planctomycetaceae bacterium]|nr:rhomboid family intramembrane serine protease [Planctomycetaceae bacterium]
MLIPINTDAPIYHFPWATIGLIVANCLCYVATGFAHPALLDYWVLEYGNGINPLEWFTAAFAHAGIIHLAGNMFFLWGFGLVVEGKLGWKRFLKLYFVLVMCWGAGVDLLTLHRTDAYVLKHVLPSHGIADLDELTRIVEEEHPRLTPEEKAEFIHEILSGMKGRCLGASGVIFALLSISLVWAPKNEMSLLVFVFFRPVTFELSILWYSLIYIGFAVLGLFADQFAMGSSGLHMVGIIIGLVAGLLYLVLGWVNCENWDLISVFTGHYGQFAREDWQLGAFSRHGNDYGEVPLPQGTGNDADSVTGSESLQRIGRLIDAGDYVLASEEMLAL